MASILFQKDYSSNRHLDVYGMMVEVEVEADGVVTAEDDEVIYEH